MNALPDYAPLPPEPSRKPVRRRKRQNPHRAIGIETGFKLGVNGILAIVAVAALVKLIPYNLAQQAKLKEIRTEVVALEGRVDHLQTDLNHQFDPQQAMSVMQTESSRVDPRQRQVRWLPPTTAQSPANPQPPTNTSSIAEAKAIERNSAFYPSSEPSSGQ